METTAAPANPARLSAATEVEPINVLHQMQALDIALERLHGLIGDLDSRLEAVLVPAPPQGETLVPLQTPFCSPLAERVLHAVIVTDRAFERLDAIAGRINL